MPSMTAPTLSPHAERRSRRIALTNQKGGPGKTTVSVHLAVALVQLGHTVLIIDLDAQGNATKYLGLTRSETALGQYMAGEIAFGDTRLQSIHGVDVVPGGCNLDMTLGREKGAVAAFLLKKQLDRIDQHYDFIFFDCPPNLSTATSAALVAAEEVLIPVDEGMALDGLLDLQRSIKDVQQVNDGLHILGLLQTKTKGTEVITKDVKAAMTARYGALVFPTSIPRSAKLSQSYNHYKPLHAYDSKTKAAKVALDAFKSLAEEVVARGVTA